MNNLFGLFRTRELLQLFSVTTTVFSLIFVVIFDVMVQPENLSPELKFSMEGHVTMMKSYDL